MTVDFSGVPRSELEKRVEELLADKSELRTLINWLNDQLTSVQTRCTEQEEELRLHRREAKLVGTPEGAFLLDAFHANELAKKKYPAKYSLEYMLIVLAEESGEAARAYCHKEGAEKLRLELAQTAGVCARIAAECLKEASCP